MSQKTTGHSNRVTAACESLCKIHLERLRTAHAMYSKVSPLRRDDTYFRRVSLKETVRDMILLTYLFFLAPFVRLLVMRRFGWRRRSESPVLVSTGGAFIGPAPLRPRPSPSSWNTSWRRQRPYKPRPGSARAALIDLVTGGGGCRNQSNICLKAISPRPGLVLRRPPGSRAPCLRSAILRPDTTAWLMKAGAPLWGNVLPP